MKLFEPLWQLTLLSVPKVFIVAFSLLKLSEIRTVSAKMSCDAVGRPPAITLACNVA